MSESGNCVINILLGCCYICCCCCCCCKGSQVTSEIRTEPATPRQPPLRLHTPLMPIITTPPSPVNDTAPSAPQCDEVDDIVSIHRFEGLNPAYLSGFGSSEQTTTHQSTVTMQESPIWESVNTIGTAIVRNCHQLTISGDGLDKSSCEQLESELAACLKDIRLINGPTVNDHNIPQHAILQLETCLQLLKEFREAAVAKDALNVRCVQLIQRIENGAGELHAIEEEFRVILQMFEERRPTGI